MSDVLETILARKRGEVAGLQKRYSLAALQELAVAQPAPRGFAAALARRVAAGAPAVIAEIKRASPSRGVIRTDFEPASLARDYEAGGAAALSVLTDTDFFQGASEHLSQARAACALPVLRKDFTIDAHQVAEARALGADCILLIAAALSRAQMAELGAAARDLGMDVLLEIHDARELEQAVAADLDPAPLLGINNRNLRTFETRLETTLELLSRVPAGWEVVTESGIGKPEDIRRMRQAGVHRFLIGESLMREKSPGAALARLLGSGAPA